MALAQAPTKAFLEGGGDVGALMRGHDWSSSPLGAPESWPQSLRAVVALMINSRYPMFVAWGPKLGFLYNDSYAVILGAKHPRALGLPFRDIWAEIWDDIWPLIDKALRGEATFNEDLHLVMNRHGFDEDTWYSFSYSPVRDESGAIAGMFCACTETTQRIKAEDALRRMNDELEQRVAAALAERKVLADIVEGTNAFVQVADHDYRWLAINRASADEFERIFGRRPKVGECMLDLLADRPEHRDAVKAVWSRALAGETFTEIQAFGDPSLDRRHYEMRFSPLLDDNGHRIGAYQFVYDVTDRLRDQSRLAAAEEALRQSQKLETLGQLTGGVAHDFNNLLTPIVGTLDILQRREVGDERLQQLVGGALLAADRARTLVQRLLAFSRRQHLQPQAVDVRALIESMADLVTRSMGPTISLRFEFAESLPPAHVDPNQLELALLNLAVNARDAMPDGGTLTFGAVPDQNKYVRLSVVDTGAGMDVATLKRAVEPFFTTKGLGRGTGLGLSSVQGLAVQSGGAFELQSEPGKGATATLWLPVSGETPVPMPSTEPRPVEKPARPASILLVDDEDLVRAGTAAMLGDAGYDVIQANSAFQALQLLRNGLETDLLVTDYAMPGFTGAELATECRELRPGLRVLMITGYANLADRHAGNLPRLAKPFRQADLALAVAELLNAAPQ
jgi:signal transduction histidine kinase